MSGQLLQQAFGPLAALKLGGGCLTSAAWISLGRQWAAAASRSGDGTSSSSRPRSGQRRWAPAAPPARAISCSAATRGSGSSSSSTPSEGPQALYDSGIAAGTYRPDPLQAVTVGKLQALFEELRASYRRPTRPSGLTLVDSVAVKQSKQSWLHGLSTLLQSSSGLAPQPGLAAPCARGLYMFGGVGCGKTMLMDMFVKAAPREFQVQRTHFHDFMLDVHSRLRHAAGEADPLRRVADGIGAGTKVLALDELFVTDVADAMILHRLFGRLWDSGLVLVATSNRAPDRLYEGGLQRALFLPFIARLKEACVIHDMASPVDYRRLAHHARGLYFVEPNRDEELWEAFLEAGGGGGAPAPATLQVAMGRVLHVPDALGRAALFEFEELCGAAVAAADYISLASSFHTVALGGVPVFGPHNRSAAYRFVTLIDVLYEHRVKLMCSADAMPFELFERVYTHEGWLKQKDAAAHPAAAAAPAPAGPAPPAGGARRGAHSAPAAGDGDAGDALVDDNLGFSKDRTVSRLTEMQSLEYLAAHAEAHEPSLTLALREALDAKAAAARRGAGAGAGRAAAAAAVGQR
ncbi:hypothetical protein Rsub_12964 [Raphidocelis subcapitata]|uniref:Uncharacterized protein n=1 Tax=Raphidocelis subcapitata TaxID=307507 RepID=A0A2V0PKF9_9CHLO|nr:hypothetical protein Rsub_12964 [Raphidocelis subcapitata]|eukprot:GBG00285.1 hypothetical protein Rsub_12964 [Raphidocelis subcapitata]